MLRSTFRWMAGLTNMDQSKPTTPESGAPSSSEAPITPDAIEVDNSHTILLKIATLYAERLMNDICLVVNGIEYPAHRLILCASSDVFQVIKMNEKFYLYCIVDLKLIFFIEYLIFRSC